VQRDARIGSPRILRNSSGKRKNKEDQFFLGLLEVTLELRKVIAIIRSRLLEDVEERLKKIGVEGLTVTRVKGYGEAKSIWSQDWLGTHARIEVFAEKARAYEIASAIMEVAHTGGPGDGIICVLPVEKIFRIRTKSEIKPNEI
jgi:nitrogen regulatory protein P-II 1